MKKVELRTMEQIKYEIIKNLVDNDGNKHRAAIKLGITIRQVNRLIQIYKSYGKAGLSMVIVVDYLKKKFHKISKTKF